MSSLLMRCVPVAGVLLLSLLAAAPPAQARVSARDQAAADAVRQRMEAAGKRYDNAQVLIANNDPRGQSESNAALQDMEDAVDACTRQRGCALPDLLATYNTLLRANADQQKTDEDDSDDPGVTMDAGVVAAAAVPESARTVALLGRHSGGDAMVEYNPAIQASLRRWLTDMRPSLMTSYENYANLRAVMWPEWKRQGLPEALLFGIMAKESNGKVHVSSRVGAAGLMQFMPATGRRFGLGDDGTGFDTRFDARSAAQASAEYIVERMGQLGGNIELAIAAYNGGEGRALRVYGQYPGRSFWDQAVYAQFPAETRDYVPMVIAAAWLFLHPKQYGLDFPRPDAQVEPLKVLKPTTIYELTICLGDAGSREGWMRTLRNLNPRYQPDGWIPAGAVLNANKRIAGLYSRNCLNGARAELAHALVSADPSAAIIRTDPAYVPNVAVGDATPLAEQRKQAPAPKEKAKPAKPKTYKVGKGDSLGKVADKFDCDLAELARANGIRGKSYPIKPGQTIKLAGCGK